MNLSNPLYFLLPADYLDKDLPDTLNGNWSQAGGSSEGAVYSTMGGLKELGVSVKPIDTWPQQGIVIAHSRNLPKSRPSYWKRLYIVCWQIDHMRCDYAQAHIVSNTKMLASAGLSLYDKLLLPGLRHILHFPTELSLVPRDFKRSNMFENIVYAGAPKNLMAVFQTQEWDQMLDREGLFFRIVERSDRMGDYSQTDCILAVRPVEQQILQKPPSKLWNAWRAGVPAILGPEPGFRDYRKSELDYIEVETADQALAALIKLRDNPVLRQAMIENGRQRMKDCSVETILGQWVEFINGPLQSEAQAWFQGPAWKRSLFCLARTARMGLRKLRHSLK